MAGTPGVSSGPPLPKMYQGEPTPADYRQIQNALHSLAKERGLGHDDLSGVFNQRYGVDSMTEAPMSAHKDLYKEWTGRDWDPDYTPEPKPTIPTKRAG